MAGLKFIPANSDNADLPCEGGCDGQSTLNLTIQPEQNAHRVNWKAALDPQSDSGYIVARIIKPSGRKFAPLDMRRGVDTTYLWVGPLQENGKHQRSAWVKISLDSGTRRNFKKPESKFTFCKDASSNTPRVRRVNNHDDCEDFDSAAGEIVPFEANWYPPGMWISCGGGCCQAQTQLTRTGSSGQPKT